MTADLNLYKKLVELERRVKDLEIREYRSVIAKYTRTTTQAINTTTYTIVDFATSLWDSHAAVTTGASWKFTAPRAGKYLVTVHLMFEGSAAWDDGEWGELFIYKGGVQFEDLDVVMMDSGTATLYCNLSGAAVISLALGEYIDIRVWQNTGGSLNLMASNYKNMVSICSL